MNPLSDLNTLLPAGVKSTQLTDVGGLDVHCLVAGEIGRPLVLLLHGFPELAFSWRKVMPALARAGFFVVAPDQRGYGRTRSTRHRGETTDRSWVTDYEDDFHQASYCRMAGDARTLVAALGYNEVHAVVGHDFGSPVAGVCALLRPDIFRSVVLMSAPFAGAPAVEVSQFERVAAALEQTYPVSAEQQSGSHSANAADLPGELAALDKPRVHYQWYYSTREANENMWKPQGGLGKFLRDYYHHKSGDWPGNDIFALEDRSAAQFARLPTYYVMNAGIGMVETVAEEAPSTEQIANCQWLPESELQVYVEEYSRTGFQGGLQSYRCNTGGVNTVELRAHAGKRIEVPSLFVAGNRDWGVYQFPGDIDRLQNTLASDHRGTHLVDGAGHWVQQEKPQAVIDALLPFLESTS